MGETKKLDELFCLLKIMIRPWIDHPKVAPLVKMWVQLKFCLWGLMVTAIMYLWLPALWQRFEVTPSELYNGQLFFSCFFIVFFVVFMLTIIDGLFYMARHRKDLVPHLCRIKKNKLHEDAGFITQLLAYDKATLAYGLLQCHHRWLFNQELVAVLAGDLRKLGLFPALTALFISAAILFKADMNPSLLILRDLVALAAMYYVVAFLNFLSNKRSRHVIKLLEYAIQHADQCNAQPDPVPITNAPSA